MRAIAVGLLVLVACGSGHQNAGPPKRPNTELIVGEFARRPPEGTTAARFRGDGSITVAHEQKELDSKPLAVGTYKLDGDQLTVTYDKGEMCPAGSSGTYKVVVSKIGIRFSKVEDGCDRRAKMDGQTWYRIK